MRSASSGRCGREISPPPQCLIVMKNKISSCRLMQHTTRLCSKFWYYCNISPVVGQNPVGNSNISRTNEYASNPHWS